MKILLAVDGSEHSDAALRAIASRPWPPETVVKVISVVPHFRIPPPPGPAWSAEPRSPPEERLRTQAAIVVQDATKFLREHGLKTETGLRTGAPRKAIVEAASEWSADLIVVGSRGLTGIKRWVFRSVAQFVAAHAQCPVEVVHEPPPEAPATHASR
jgi:nucleotide-binding universal stress UspA family protein